MNVPANYTEALSLRQQVAYVLKLLQKASADTIAMEIMELRGIASEESVAALVIEVKKELTDMQEEALVEKENINHKNVWRLTID